MTTLMLLNVGNVNTGNETANRWQIAPRRMSHFLYRTRKPRMARTNFGGEEGEGEGEGRGEPRNGPPTPDAGQLKV